jgi:hypothetical protein
MQYLLEAKADASIENGDTPVKAKRAMPVDKELLLMLQSKK